MKCHVARRPSSRTAIGSIGLGAVLWLVAAAVPVHAADGDYVWAKQMTGHAVSYGASVDVDSDGYVYTPGRFTGTIDFDPGIGVASLTPFGGGDIFISKLDNTGAFVWVKQIGGTAGESVLSLALDDDGNVYITGQLLGTVDFDPGVGTTNLTSAGDSDIFIAKYDASGSLAWAKSIGGTGFDEGVSIAVDGDGNVYATGEFMYIVDFDPGPGTYNIDSGLVANFVCKLTSTGELAWAGKFAGNINLAGGIAVDGSGNVYTTGRFNGATDFDPGSGAAVLSPVNGYDVYIAKLNSSGAYVWAKGMGGNGEDDGLAVMIDSSDNVLIAGRFAETVDFDPGTGTAEITTDHQFEAFVAKLDSGGGYVWAKQLGASESRSVAVDAYDNVYATGYFSGTADLDPGAAVQTVVSAGSFDVFATKLNSAGTCIWARQMGGLSTEVGNDIAVGSDENVLLTGYFGDTADFDPGSGTATLTTASNGGQEAYVVKLAGPIPPVVSSITRVGETPTDSEYVDFLVVFDQSVAGVDASDFNLTVTGMTGAYVSNVSGSGASYTVTVYTGTGEEGTIRLNLTDDDSIVNSDLTPLGNAGAGNGNYTSGEGYDYFPLPLCSWPVAATLLLTGLWLLRRTQRGYCRARS